MCAQTADVRWTMGSMFHGYFNNDVDDDDDKCVVMRSHLRSHFVTHAIDFGECFFFLFKWFGHFAHVILRLLALALVELTVRMNVRRFCFCSKANAIEEIDVRRKKYHKIKRC